MQKIGRKNKYLCITNEKDEPENSLEKLKEETKTETEEEYFVGKRHISR